MGEDGDFYGVDGGGELNHCGNLQSKGIEQVFLGNPKAMTNA